MGVAQRFFQTRRDRASLTFVLRTERRFSTAVRPLQPGAGKSAPPSIRPARAPRRGMLPIGQPRLGRRIPAHVVPRRIDLEHGDGEAEGDAEESILGGGSRFFRGGRARRGARRQRGGPPAEWHGSPDPCFAPPRFGRPVPRPDYPTPFSPARKTPCFFRHRADASMARRKTNPARAHRAPSSRRCSRVGGTAFPSPSGACARQQVSTRGGNTPRGVLACWPIRPPRTARTP